MKMKLSCRVTHELIVSGNCPWCDSTIIDGRIDRPSSQQVHIQSSTLITWDVAAIKMAIADKPKSYILSALSDLLLHESRTELFLPVLRMGIKHFDPDVRWMSTQILIHRGVHLLSQNVEQYEKHLQDDPNDVVVRLILLCYYFTERASLVDTSRRIRQRHILWIIEKNPSLISFLGPYALLNSSNDDDEKMYRQTRALWENQIVAKNNEDIDIIGNIADFFMVHDPELSETYYLKAKKMEPNNLRWSRKLAHLYVLRMHDAKADVEHREFAKKALVEYEVFLNSATDALCRFWLLPDLAKQAFEAHELEKAHSYATQLLQMASLSNKLMQNEGDAIHYGHLILGRLALKRGDKEKSKWHLLEAGKSKGSPALKSFGPNMILAKELLDLGEADVVIQYLDYCSHFWHSIDHKPQRWIYTIVHGGVPDFGANL